MVDKNNAPWEKVELAPAWNQKLEDGSFPLEEGDEIIGTFVGMETEVGANAANLYSFKGEDGKIISVWGGTILDTRLKNIEVGEEVKITYLGDEKGKKGWVYHNYDVFHRKVEETKEENKKDVQSEEERE